MNSAIITLNNCRFETLTDGKEFLGLGKVWIDDVLVRSGRLPLKVYSQVFSGGLELFRLELVDVAQSAAEVRLQLRACFRPLPVKLMRDHSFDPIHETGDWDQPVLAGSERLDLVLRPARDSFNGVDFQGFSYHWDYQGDKIELFYLMDMASWELDGDVNGATAYSQSSCTPPVCTFGPDNAWSTEGILFFLVEGGNQNPCMTHNLPRFASHGSFDYQFKGEHTLIGVFERVELIRSILCREKGKAELKCFDKHFFDQADKVSTAPKKILLSTARRSVVAQQNLWTWIHCVVEERARQEFGLVQEQAKPVLAQNFWVNFTVDSYYSDLLPAAASLGCQRIFVDNLKKSAYTEDAPLAGKFTWNMCCGHEYEIAKRLGGNVRVKSFVERARELGVEVYSWTNNDQALSSPLNQSERDAQNWFVRLEDTRQKYGGAYAGVMSVLDYSADGARDYFVESHVKIKEEAELSCYLFDSFYNLAFMPVTYRDCKARTMWRGLLQAVKRLQDAGVHFIIESFGPFGQLQHGHAAEYNLENIFICYRVGPGNDYSTVPSGHPLKDTNPKSAAALYYGLAHMAVVGIPLFIDKQRVDHVWGAEHRQALRDYHQALPALGTRYMQEDGQGVLWHDAAGTRATLFNFAQRVVALPGKLRDETAGRDLPAAASYQLQPGHTYTIISAQPLPRCVSAQAAALATGARGS